jgi:hypothetical protein
MPMPGKLDMNVMCPCGKSTPVNPDLTPQINGRFVCFDCAPEGTKKNAYKPKVLPD